MVTKLTKKQYVKIDSSPAFLMLLDHFLIHNLLIFHDEVPFLSTFDMRKLSPSRK